MVKSSSFRIRLMGKDEGQIRVAKSLEHVKIFSLEGKRSLWTFAVGVELNNLDDLNAVLPQRGKTRSEESSTNQTVQIHNRQKIGRRWQSRLEIKENQTYECQH